MFERFTDGARRVVVLAQESARERADGYIGTEHLLLALCDRPQDAVVGAVLARHDVDRETVLRDLDSWVATERDRDALASVGIDLDAVRHEVEQSFGPGALERTRAAGRGRRDRAVGHIPFDDDAKRSLAYALRAAVDAHSRTITPVHVLSAIAHQTRSPGGAVLARHGVDAAAIRAAGDPGPAADGDHG